MIIYMTRLSFFDTAEDFDLQMAAQMYKESRQVLHDLLYEPEHLPPSHPTLKMWEGSEIALGVYAQVMGVRLTQHGVNKGLTSADMVNDMDYLRRQGHEFELPEWFEETDVLRAYRSNMARRWPTRFATKWPGTPELMPYIWPVGDQLLVSKDDKARLATGERVLPKKIADRISNL